MKQTIKSEKLEARLVGAGIAFEHEHQYTSPPVPCMLFSIPLKTKGRTLRQAIITVMYEAQY
jgi:hypothetical protein